MEKVFLAKIELIRPILRWIREQLHEIPWDEKGWKKIELAVEEALVNIVRHAYLGKPEKIRLKVIHHPKQRVEIVIEDSGPPFDPLSTKLPNVSGNLEEREIGGLGIMMMRQNMDEIRYQRKGKSNVLTLVKTIHSSQSL